MSVYKGDKLIVGSVHNPDLIPDAAPTKDSQRHVMSGGVYTACLPKEDTANKTTVVDASSTDDQYPSAKAVYDALGTLEPANIGYARDLYAPDWNHAVAITSDALLLGYRAPKRGIFIGSTIPYDVGQGFITINGGLKIAYGYKSTAISGQSIPISLSVAANDVIQSSVRMQLDTDYSIFFVPYKAQ